jgi:hypothetical protein
MTHEFLLVSAEDGASLSFLFDRGAPDYITVTADGRGFCVQAPVYTYMSPSLPTFFDELAEGDPHKTATVIWESLEGELRLEASRDLLGHIFMVFHVRSIDIGSNRWWSFTGRIVLELGSMQLHCKRVREFWNAAAT